eukprot:1155712-Pelagomonas_calceolata.AAC.2
MKSVREVHKRSGVYTCKLQFQSSAARGPGSAFRAPKEGPARANRGAGAHALCQGQGCEL